jgi:carotenoid cleavage dioxygenase-like enzyme
MPDLVPVDMSTHPFLSGRFAPVHDEIAADDLPVTGTVPTDITGAYLRNGPNPRFAPLGSYTYPLEGDGMVHGLWFEGGRVRYANRWVETQGLRAEERAGRAIFGGIMSPALVDTALLGDDPDPGWPFKLDAFINVVRHGGRFLALEEGTPPYEIGPDLATIGRYDFDGGLPAGMCAHPKVDPVTGEMVVFRYDVEAPFLTWAVIGPDGRVTQPATPVEGVDEGYMIHDFVITERSIVLVVNPMAFDLSAPEMLVWRPEQGCRIAVIPRDGASPTRWAHTDAFWAWHFGNGHEDDHGTIHLDMAWYSAPGLLLPPEERARVRAGFVRAEVDPDRGTVELHHLGDDGVEFPRIDDRLVGRRHTTVVAAGASGDRRVRPGEHDVLHLFDVEAGTRTRYESGASLGEPVFVPRDGSTGERDGYYVAYATDLDRDDTRLLVFDAADFPAAPVAEVHLPRRVPNGLHGSWIPAV